MSRYFFHIRQGEEFVPDEEGAEFTKYLDAKKEGIFSARDVAIDLVKRGERIKGLKVEIVDESGTVLDTIHAQEFFN